MDELQDPNMENKADIRGNVTLYGKGDRDKKGHVKVLIL